MKSSSFLALRAEHFAFGWLVGTTWEPLISHQCSMVLSPFCRFFSSSQDTLSDMWTTAPLCGAKMQYLLTWKVASYCLLSLDRSITTITIDPFRSGYQSWLPRKQETLHQWCPDIGPASQTVTSFETILGQDLQMVDLKLDTYKMSNFHLNLWDAVAGHDLNFRDS